MSETPQNATDKLGNFDHGLGKVNIEGSDYFIISKLGGVNEVYREITRSQRRKKRENEMFQPLIIPSEVKKSAAKVIAKQGHKNVAKFVMDGKLHGNLKPVIDRLPVKSFSDDAIKEQLNRNSTSLSNVMPHKDLLYNPKRSFIAGIFSDFGLVIGNLFRKK